MFRQAKGIRTMLVPRHLLYYVLLVRQTHLLRLLEARTAGDVAKMQLARTRAPAR